MNYRIGKYRIRELLVVGICTASYFTFFSLTYVDDKSRKRTQARGNSRPLPVFDQQVFVEAMGAATVANAQASTAGG